MALPKTDELIEILAKGRDWKPPREELREFLESLFEERYHKTDWRHFQARPSYMPDGASWAGWILADNPTSGAYQGTSFVWFPGDGGSVAVLVLGTAGFGPDANILGRPGHRRRLEGLARMHGVRLWVKRDPMDMDSQVPDVVAREWPEIEAARKAYASVIYAAVPVRDGSAAERAAVEDLMDLFAAEHNVRLTGPVKKRWEKRRQEMLASLFPRVDEDHVSRLLDERRFVVLQGPPGTGKTRLAQKVAEQVGDPTVVQFHPARTYEDFVVGLAPKPAATGLTFEVKPGDLVRANERAQQGPHVLVIDEINRGDLSRILGEAIFLFEPGEPDREVELAHPVNGSTQFSLAPGLKVLGTLNTADRSIARIDVAIRRRFAFLDIWPDLQVVAEQEVELATTAFEDCLDVFTQHADDAGLRLLPGHAYFLDPRPDLGPDGREARVHRRLQFELVPLLRSYVDEHLLGPATSEVAGLADRIEARLREVAA